MPDDIDDIIEEVMAAPKRAQGDMGSMENHSIPDLIALKKFLAGQEVVGGTTTKSPKLLINRLVPPGAA